MRTEPILILAEVKKVTGVSMAFIQKQLGQVMRIRMFNHTIEDWERAFNDPSHWRG